MKHDIAVYGHMTVDRIFSEFNQTFSIGAIGNFWEGKDSDGNPLFDMPAWMTTPIGELFPDAAAWGQMFKNYIYDPGQVGRGGSGAGRPMKIFGQEISWPGREFAPG